MCKICENLEKLFLNAQITSDYLFIDYALNKYFKIEDKKEDCTTLICKNCGKIVLNLENNTKENNLNE